MLPNLYIDHFVYRVQDLAATDKFYTAIFGEPSFRSEATLVYHAGDTMLFFTPSPRSPSDQYDKEQPGLNHIAFGVHQPAQLRQIQDHLNNAAVKHSGIGIDSHGKKEYLVQRSQRLPPRVLLPSHSRITHTPRLIAQTSR